MPFDPTNPWLHGLTLLIIAVSLAIAWFGAVTRR
jgi:hypothetical protein